VTYEGAVKIKNSFEVYHDGRFVLGQEDGQPFIEINGERYGLSCHPYEPCLYITGKNGALTAVHNSFDPSAVLWAFSDGRTVTSITGTEYDACDFCRMVEYAAGMGDVQIDEAEQIFRGRPKKKGPEAGSKSGEAPAYYIGSGAVNEGPVRPEAGWLIEDDPFYRLIGNYPDCVIDYCLVKNGRTTGGYDAHRNALLWACRKLFADEDDEASWHYDIGRADAEQISSEALFGPVEHGGELNYRKAFLEPPYTSRYTDADFEAVNAALFPEGTEGLEVYRWNTGWSDYFDDGREWWGTLCLTVYDKKVDRFVVIMASATD
jgi:hypothetical protein